MSTFEAAEIATAIEGTVVQYGIETPTSRTVLMVTEDRGEAERMLDMLGRGRLIVRTVSYSRWRDV
jgi:hypothetical protein